MKKDHIMMPGTLITGLAMPMHDIAATHTPCSIYTLFIVKWPGKLNHLTEQASLYGIQMQCVGQNDAHNKRLLPRNFLLVQSLFWCSRKKSLRKSQHDV